MCALEDTDGAVMAMTQVDGEIFIAGAGKVLDWSKIIYWIPPRNLFFTSPSSEKYFKCRNNTNKRFKIKVCVATYPILLCGYKFIQNATLFSGFVFCLVLLYMSIKPEHSPLRHHITFSSSTNH